MTTEHNARIIAGLQSQVRNREIRPQTLISYDLKGESMAKLVDVVLCHRTNQFVTLGLHFIIESLYDFTSLFRMLFSWTKLPLDSQLDFFIRLQLYNRFLRCVLGFLMRTICSINLFNHCMQTVQTNSIIYSANLWIDNRSIHILFVHKSLVLRLQCANLVFT